MTYNMIKRIVTYAGLAGLLLGAYPKESEAQQYRTPSKIGEIMRGKGGEETKYWELQRAIQFFQDNPNLFKDLKPLDTLSFDSTFSTTLEVEPFQPRLPFDIGLPAILNNEYKRPRKFLLTEAPATEEVHYADPLLQELELKMRLEEYNSNPESKEHDFLFPKGRVSLEVRTEEKGNNVLILQGRQRSYTPDKALEMILDLDIQRVNSLLEQTQYEPQPKKEDEPLTFGGVEINNSLTPRPSSRMGGFIDLTQTDDPNNSVEEEGIMDDYIPDTDYLIQLVPYGNFIFQNHSPTITTSPVMLVR